MVVLELLVDSSGEMKRLARILAKHLQPGDCIVLEGGLGVGKTTFVQGLAEGLGITERVNSPTFVLVKEYEGRIPLYHLDLYRLGHADFATPSDAGVQLSEDELETADYLEAVISGEGSAGAGIVAVEWPEAIASLLPPGYLQLQLWREQDGRRRIKVSAFGARARACCDSWAAEL